MEPLNPKFKIWQLGIDENDLNTGVEYVALVDDPAILRNWQAFSNAQKVVYQIASQDRHIVQGPLMIPNMPIFRSDDVHGEHYVMYSKESIEKIVRKFFKQKNTGNVNLMHLPAATTSDVFMLESFIIDSSRGMMAPKGFGNLPDGTWFGSYAVQNDDIWKAVQDGTFKGFSVEGYFGYSDPKDVEHNRIANLIEAVTNGTPQQLQHLQEIRGNMAVLNFLNPDQKLALRKLLFGDAPTLPAPAATPVDQADANKGMTKDGQQLYAEGGFVQGSKIFIVTPEGNQPAPDSTYELDNGTICEVMNGTIMNVTEAAATSATPAAPAAPPVAQVAQFSKEQIQAITDQIAAFKTEMETKVTALTSSIQSVTEKFNATETEFRDLKTATQQIFTIMEKLDGTPSNEPVDKTLENKSGKISHAEESESRLRSLSHSLSKIKSA